MFVSSVYIIYVNYHGIMDIVGQEGLNAAGFETRWVRGFSYPSVPAPTLTHTPAQLVPRLSLSLSLSLSLPPPGVKRPECGRF